MLPASRLASTPHRRPLGIMLLVGVYCLAALLAALAAFFVTGSLRGSLSTLPALVALLPVGLLLALSLLIGWIAYGLWRLKGKTYRLAIGLHGVVLLSTLLSMLQSARLSPRDTSAVLLNALALVYLSLPTVRAAFQPPAAEGTIE